MIGDNGGRRNDMDMDLERSGRSNEQCMLCMMYEYELWRETMRFGGKLCR